MRLDMAGVIALEVSITGLMEMDHNRHDFAFTQPGLSYSSSTLGQLSILHLLAKIIDSAKQFQ